MLFVWLKIRSIILHKLNRSNRSQTLSFGWISLYHTIIEAYKNWQWSRIDSVKILFDLFRYNLLTLISITSCWWFVFFSQRDLRIFMENLIFLIEYFWKLIFMKWTRRSIPAAVSLSSVIPSSSSQISAPT